MKLLIACFAVLAVFLTAGQAFAEDRVIGEIKVAGNDKTKTEVILAEIMFESGDTYTDELPKEIQRRIMNLQYFIGVLVQGEPVAGTNKVNILIACKERMTWGFYPIVAISSDTDVTDHEFGVEVSESNLFGRGNYVSAGYRTQGDLKTTTFSYYDRHLKYSDFTFGAGFTTQTNQITWYGIIDNDVDIWSAYLQTGYWFSYEFRGTLGFSTREDKYTGGLIPYYGRTDKVYLTLLYTDIEYTLYAYQGPSIAITYTRGKETISDDDIRLSVFDDISYGKMLIAGTYYWNTTKDHIFRMSLNYGQTNEAPWWDGYSVGGNGSVRGYPGGAMQGEKYFQTILEYRVPLLVKKDLFAGLTYTVTVFPFIDAGNAWTSDSDFGETIIGGGVGFRAYIHQWQAGTLALDLAQGFDKDKGGDFAVYLSFGAIY